MKICFGQDNLSICLETNSIEEHARLTDQLVRNDKLKSQIMDGLRELHYKVQEFRDVVVR